MNQCTVNKLQGGFMQKETISDDEKCDHHLSSGSSTGLTGRQLPQEKNQPTKLLESSCNLLARLAETDAEGRRSRARLFIDELIRSVYARKERDIHF